MHNLIKRISSNVNSLIWSFIINGVILLFLAILFVFTEFMLEFVAGLFTLVLSYTFFYAAYKLWSAKKEIENHFKIK